MVTKLTEKEQKHLFSKLRSPLHIGYISTYVLKKSLDETKLIIDDLIQEEIIEESSYAKEYYVLKTQNNL